MGTFLGMGDWGRRWRKASALARAQRAAEKRALPPVLAAHEVEAFRGQWKKEELGLAEQALEELEAIAEWGHEVWKERGSATPARGAPADSKWEGRASSEVLGRGKALASEAERIILDSLVAAAGRLHPAGGGRSRQVRRGGGEVAVAEDSGQAKQSASSGGEGEVAAGNGGCQEHAEVGEAFGVSGR